MGSSSAVQEAAVQCSAGSSAQEALRAGSSARLSAAVRASSHSAAAFGNRTPIHTAEHQEKSIEHVLQHLRNRRHTFSQTAPYT